MAVGCTSLLRCTGHLAVSEALQEEIDSAVLMLLSYLAHLGEECKRKVQVHEVHGVTCRRPLEDEPHAAITSEAEIFSLMYNAAAPYRRTAQLDRICARVRLGREVLLSRPSVADLRDPAKRMSMPCPHASQQRGQLT